MSQIIPKEWTENGFMLVPAYFITNEKYRELSSEAKWLYTIIFNYWLMTKKHKSLEEGEILHAGCTKKDLVEASDMYLHEVTWTVEELKKFGLVVEEKNENGDINFLPEISLKWPKSA